MKKTAMSRLTVFLTGILIGAAMMPAGAPGGGCADAMALLDETILKFSSRECSFSHSVSMASGGSTETEEGRLWAEKGGKMRWEYSAPAGKLAVTDGKTAWIYLPDEKRAYKLKVPSRKHLPVPLRLLSGRSKPSGEFFCVSSSSSGGVTTIELGFNEKDVKFRRLAVSLDERERSITGISYVDELDNKVSYSFSGGVKNGKIDPRFFSFTPPAGTRVSEEVDEEVLGMIEK